MAFKDDMKRKIPMRLKTMEYKVLVDMIKRKSLGSYDTLRDYLNRREIDLKNWVRTNASAGSTMNRWMARKKSELDFVRFVKKTFLKYLR